ncbi:MAG: hypothetical protein U0939_16080 [Pirellulales bacterium]
MTRVRNVLTAFVVLNAAWVGSAARAETLDASIPAWIQQLNADEYAERKEAAAKLAEAGKAALPALAEAARSPDREVSARSLEILKRHYGSGDARLKQAAKETLESLAKGEPARVASLAQQILNPAVFIPVRGQPNNVQVLAAARARLAQQNAQRIAVQRQAIPQLPINVRPVNGAQVITVTQRNGERQMNVREPNRQIQIVVDGRGAIKIEVTTTKDGKAETKRASGKDEAELKQNHPDEYKLFLELKPRFGVPIAPFNGRQVFPNALPNALPNAGPPPARPAPALPAG